MAGGKGSRLWPLSRSEKPKQFQKLISDKTMLQETVDRVLSRFPVEDVFISTNKLYADEARRELPSLPKANFIEEPNFRERASCIALATAIFNKKGFGDEVIAVLPSDHFIKDEERLLDIFIEAEGFLNYKPDYLVALGAKPTNAETGYGYIQHEFSPMHNDRWISGEYFRIEKFVEKPESAVAEKFFEEKGMLWNMGIYLWKASTIIDRFQTFLPNTHKKMCRFEKMFGTEDFNEILEKEYCHMDMVSIENAIVEKDDKVVVVPTDIGWSDVGSWSVLKDSLVEDKDSHLVKGEHIDVDSKNLLVYGCGKPIVTIGLRDLVIVDTDDVVLICDKNKSQLVKEAVKKLEKSGRIHLL